MVSITAPKNESKQMQPQAVSPPNSPTTVWRASRGFSRVDSDLSAKVSV